MPYIRFAFHNKLSMYSELSRIPNIYDIVECNRLHPKYYLISWNNISR